MKNDHGFGRDADPEGDALQVVSVNGQAALLGQSFDLAEGGRLAVRADGAFVFNPAGDFDDLAPGETADTFATYEITDGLGGFDTAEMTFTVQGASP